MYAQIKAVELEFRLEEVTYKRKRDQEEAERKRYHEEATAKMKRDHEEATAKMKRDHEAAKIKLDQAQLNGAMLIQLLQLGKSKQECEEYLKFIYDNSV